MYPTIIIAKTGPSINRDFAQKQYDDCAARGECGIADRTGKYWALITIGLVLYSKHRYPNPERFEATADAPEAFRLKKSFVYYMIAIGLFAFGFVDFTLITLHAAKTRAFPEATLGLLYAAAMGVDAFAALFFGWLFDKIGLKALISTSVQLASIAFYALCVRRQDH